MSSAGQRDDEPMWPMSARGPAQGSLPYPDVPGGQSAPAPEGVAPGVPAQSGPVEVSGGPAQLGPAEPGENPEESEPPRSGTAARRRPRLRWVALAVVLIVVSALAVAATVALNIYDEETKIDRSTPTVAVAQLVEAMFTRRDEAEVARFSCEKSQLDSLRNLATDVIAQEKSYGTHIAVSVDSVKLLNGSTVEAQLSLGSAEWSAAQLWIFDTADQDGWRVCAARRGG